VDWKLEEMFAYKCDHCKGVISFSSAYSLRDDVNNNNNDDDGFNFFIHLSYGNKTRQKNPKFEAQINANSLA